MTIEEIQARKAEISTEIDSSEITEERLAELETEVKSLNDEEETIERKAEMRKELERAVITSSEGSVEIPENNINEGENEMNYREAFLKNLQGKDLTVEERTAVSASAAIPTETMNKIIDTLEGAPIFNAIDVTYFPSNVTYPVASTVNDASWVDMGTAATDSGDTLGSVSLAAYKLIKTVEITADVQNMAVDAFEDWLVARLGDKLSKAIDVAVLTGNGSSKATGIATTKSSADTTYTSTGPTYADICGIIGSLPTAYHSNASFVMGRDTFFGEVLGMVDTTNNRVVVADAQSPAKFNILGYPVIVDDNVTSGDILFGDLKAYKFNFAKAPEVASDDSVGFRTGSRVYRAMALCDGKLADASAIVRAVAATA